MEVIIPVVFDSADTVCAAQILINQFIKTKINNLMQNSWIAKYKSYNQQIVAALDYNHCSNQVSACQNKDKLSDFLLFYCNFYQSTPYSTRGSFESLDCSAGTI